MNRSWLLVTLLPVLAACSLGPDYVRPTVEVPQTYKETRGWKPAQPADTALRGDWWTLFGDPALDALQVQVDVSNQNLLAAKGRFLQARAQVGLAQAAGAPQVSAGAVADRARVSANVVGRSLAGQTVNDFALPLSASWEIDLWGRIGKGVEGARAAAQAGAADVETARLALHAELALDYFQARSLDAEQRLLRQTIAGYEKALQMTTDRNRVGIASAVDLAQAQTQLDTARAQMIDLGVRRAQFEHAIATLIGRPPANFSLPPLADSPASAVEQIGPAPAIPLALPSALLERRPDIAAAERRVVAANAQIGAAKAAFFPALVLGGSGGLESSALSQLLTAPSRFWALGPLLAVSLLDGGARRARTEGAQAGYDTAVAEYRQQTLTAFQEVEDNLAELRILSDEAQVQARAVNSAERALALALDRYRVGATAYLDVVVAQTAALSGERVAVDIARRRMLASVLLVKALGGGWQQSDLSTEMDQLAATPTPAPK